MTLSIEKRRSARLAAVQYLYQWKLEGQAQPVERYIETYSQRILEEAGKDKEEYVIAPDTPPDFAFLRKLLSGLAEQHETVQAYLAKQMEKGRAHSRTSPLIQSLLEAGTYELIHHDGLKPSIVLSEYTALAAGFFDNPELAFVNGTLQEVCNSLRA